MRTRYRLLRWVAIACFRLLTRLEIYGAEHIPKTGPVLVAVNHLHWLDPPIGLVVVPRQSTVFAADKWMEMPGIGHLLRFTQQAISVRRGEIDRQALREALGVLKSGGVLGISPEGTRSRTGGLQQGHTGAAYLASRTGVPILPIVVYGQEHAFATLKRLRRPRIVVVVGAPFVLPGTPNRAKAEELEAYTDQIMRRLAALLPPQYRGVYA